MSGSDDEVSPEPFRLAQFRWECLVDREFDFSGWRTGTYSIAAADDLEACDGKTFFTIEFKHEAVKLVQERGMAARQAAKDWGLHQNVLRKWVRDANANGKNAFPWVRRSATR